MMNQLIKTVERYEKLAKRAKLPKLNYNVSSVTDIYRQFDTDILKKVCTKRTENVIKFTRDITRHIDIGIPVAWSVMLGKIEESPPLPQIVGGHMRLIIGYNKTKNQLIYTDSWGSGHEYKDMGIKDALTITTGLYTIEPRSRRF